MHNGIVRIVSALLALVAGVALFDPCLAATRSALIIANYDYATLPKLTNPEHDATLVESKLKELGFSSRIERNLTGQQLAHTIHAYIRSLPRQAEVVIYFAGHGIHFGGENAFAGIDAVLDSPTSVRRHTYPLTALIDHLNEKSAVSMIFWDACRDNPLRLGSPNQIYSGDQLPTYGAVAFSERHVSADLLVMFAAAPGQVARDGKGTNSPFAEALVRHMGTPNVNVDTVVRLVTNDVRTATNGSQRPQVVAQLDREYIFNKVGDAAIAASNAYEAEVRRLREQLAQLEANRTSSKTYRVVPAGTAVASRENQSTNQARSSTDGKQPTYHQVEVLFGTSRREEQQADLSNRKRLTFGTTNAQGLLLGSATVTIPTIRARGDIPRPGINIIGVRIGFNSWEDPAKHFTIQRIERLTKEDFKRSVDDRIDKASKYKGQALVFVHGFNTSFDDALFRTAQISHDLEFDGATFSFSWPSQGSLLGYVHDTETAQASGRWLLELLTLVTQETKATTINLIAHSVGNRAVLDAIARATQILDAAGRSRLQLGEIIFAAPDVPRDEFVESIERARKVAKGGITLYASSKDWALQISKMLRLSPDLIRAGDIPATGPIVEAGIDTIDVSEASGSMFVLNHTTFAERRHLVRDMGFLFQSGIRPPDVRSPIFMPVNNPPQTFWKYITN
jgi:esterase/lipase superfamily enzyme